MKIIRAVWLAMRRLAGGPSVIVLGDDESAIVLDSSGRVRSLHITNGGERLDDGADLVGRVYVAVNEDPVGLRRALEDLTARYLDD